MKPCLCCITQLTQDGEYEMCMTYYDEAMKQYKKTYPKQYNEYLERQRT